MAEMPPVAVYPKRPRRDGEPSTNQAVCAVTPPEASTTTPRTIFKFPENKPDAVAQQPRRAVTLGPAALAVPRQDTADSRQWHLHTLPPAASNILLPAWKLYLQSQQLVPQSLLAGLAQLTGFL